MFSIKSFSICLSAIIIFCSTNFAQIKFVVFNATGKTSEEKLIALTLAGIVNRDSARLYLLNAYETWCWNQTDEKWIDIYQSKGNQFETITTTSALINKFRSKINGALIYDLNRTYSNFIGQSFRYQGEFAAIIGALTNRLPMSKASALSFGLNIADSVLAIDFYDGDSYKYLPGDLSQTKYPWNNSSLTEEQKYFALIEYGIQNILPLCNPEKFYLREITDWAVKHRMFQVNLAGTDELKFESLPDAKAQYLETILNFYRQKNLYKIFHIYGWMRPEPLVQWFNCFGASFHETLLSNLSFHSAYPANLNNLTRPSKTDFSNLQLEDKCYLIFIGTEGDAGNWNFGFQAGAWLSSSRGQVPLAWGWNLHLLSECKFVARYYYETATQNDGFIGVTTPLGYAFPDLWQNDVWQNAVQSSSELISLFDIKDFYAYKHYANGLYSIYYRGKFISNSFDFAKLGQFNSLIGSDVVFLFDPLLQTQTAYTNYGGILFNHVNDGTYYGDVSDLQATANKILSTLKSKQRPFFYLAGYQRLRQDDFTNRTSPSNSDISLPKLIQLINYLKNDPEIGNKIEILTPEKFSYLLRKKLSSQKNENNILQLTNFNLKQNYPNPFNPETEISFSVGNFSEVEFRLYNSIGQFIGIPLKGFFVADEYSFKLNLSYLAAGTYFLTMTGENYSKTIKMILLK